MCTSSQSKPLKTFQVLFQYQTQQFPYQFFDGSNALIPAAISLIL